MEQLFNFSVKDVETEALTIFDGCVHPTNAALGKVAENFTSQHFSSQTELEIAKLGDSRIPKWLRDRVYLDAIFWDGVIFSDNLLIGVLESKLVLNRDKFGISSGELTTLKMCLERKIPYFIAISKYLKCDSHSHTCKYLGFTEITSKYLDTDGQMKTGKNGKNYMDFSLQYFMTQLIKV